MQEENFFYEDRNRTDEIKDDLRRQDGENEEKWKRGWGLKMAHACCDGRMEGMRKRKYSGGTKGGQGRRVELVDGVMIEGRETNIYTHTNEDFKLLFAFQLYLSPSPLSNPSLLLTSSLLPISNFFHILPLVPIFPILPHSQNPPFAHLDLGRPYENPRVGLALEIAHPCHAAVVLAYGLVELDANPRPKAWELGHGADVAD